MLMDLKKKTQHKNK